ncbi:MAG: leucine-rich repeat domain-containing protein, partial [Bacteroidota bacterium]
SLRNNQLSGSIPNGLISAQRLNTLDLSHNQLTGNIPYALGSLPELHTLELNDNQLTGSVPPSLANYSKNTLHLQNNQLSGCFHPYLSKLCSNTQGINMFGNVGLPDGGNFSSFCNSNNGVCNTPIETCHPDAPALMAIYDATNGPNWTSGNNWNPENNCDVCTWSGVRCNVDGRVRRLLLSNRGLTGEMPAELSDITTLVELDLSNNNLTGILPVKIGSLTNLQDMNVSQNQVTGEIPDDLGRLPLTHLKLNNNQLQGCIPSSLKNLCGINVDISNNPNLNGNGSFSSYCSSNTGACTMEVAVKVLLQGAYNSNTGLMDDGLRSAGLIPMTYEGSTISSESVLDEEGANAIVDWVSVELRFAGQPQAIMGYRNALLQRDGDVVDVDGKSALNFDGLPAGNYYVAVLHRNHLSMMTRTTIMIE